MSIEGNDDLDGLREAGRVVRTALEAMKRHVRPGVTTDELNAIGAAVLREHGARSAPMLVYGFPKEVCISLRARARLTRGLVLTVEPMVTMGAGDVVQARDDRTIRTADGSMAAHYEQTIVITKG
jgi:methionine aminopeptidase